MYNRQVQKMTNTEKTTELANYLRQLNIPEPSNSEERLHVDEIFGTAYFAFEQLRNAADYSEQHLLMRKSIERYLKRNINWGLQAEQDFASDLVIELTQSRYIKNDSIGLEIISRINEQADYYSKVFQHTIRYLNIDKGRLNGWVNQIASAHFERLIVKQTGARDGFLGFAFRHFGESIRTQEYNQSDSNFQKSLYVAIQRAILRSDIASVRYQMYNASFFYQQMSPSVFVQMNEEVDEIFRSQLTNKLTRLVDRNGSAMRVIENLVDLNKDFEKLLADKTELKRQTEEILLQRYALVDIRLRQGIIKSVVFIFITKIFVGVAIEIPYDLLRNGFIDFLPLTLNIVFPPIYMASLGFAIQKPSVHNLSVVKRNVINTLFDTKQDKQYHLEDTGSRWSVVFNIVYGLTFITSIGLVVYLLRLLGFNIVQATLFFVFLSAVSFFSVRLVDSTKDYVAVESTIGLRDLVFNIFMTPFIKIGQKLSDTYAQINFITYILDFAIEMPLKTSLAFVREWSQFLQGKRDRL